MPGLRYKFADKDCAIWYAKYPLHEAPRDVERAWAKLTPEEREAALEVVDEFAAMWARLQREGKKLSFCPYPATYLNGRRFYKESEPPAVSWRDAHADF